MVNSNTSTSSSMKCRSEWLSDLHKIHQVNGPYCFSKSFLSICHAHSICTSVVCLNVFLPLWMPQLHLVPWTSGKWKFFLRKQCYHEGISKSQDIYTRRQKYTWLQLKYHDAEQGDKHHNKINTINCFYACPLIRSLTYREISHTYFSHNLVDNLTNSVPTINFGLL